MEERARREAELQAIIDRINSRSAGVVAGTLAFVKPRVGGGTDENSAWVGGSSLTPRTRPASRNAFRPVNLKYMPHRESAYKDELPESYKLEVEDDKDKTFLRS